MISYKDEKIKRQLIMEHYSKPKNKVAKVEQWVNVEVHSQNCVDNLELAVLIEGPKITNAQFSGQGCAIFLASCDIFLEKIKNQSIIKALDIARNYELLINKQSADEVLLEELNVFGNVKTHLNRLECASLIYKAFNAIIEK